MDITSANDAEDMKEFCSLITAISEKTGTGESLSALRAPLQLALFISPICLLFPFQIIKKSFNRQLVITTAIKLGNEKPKLILDIEKCMYLEDTLQSNKWNHSTMLSFTTVVSFSTMDPASAGNHLRCRSLLVQIG